MDLDTNVLDDIDVIAFATDELLTRFRSAKNKNEEILFIEEYLETCKDDENYLNVNFEKDLDWFNVTEPISKDELKGKLVVLDFFTYCCINCMHVLPDLKLIEEKFSVEDGLLIIGVHSPKFENEKDSANILSAIQRYNITHPIVNDSNSCLWRFLNIKCWPTLIVLTPNSSALLILMGEGHRKFLEIFTETALLYFRKRKLLNHAQLPLSPSTNLMPASNLKFPAKIACMPKNDFNETQLFAISDSGNHRILVFDINGFVLHRIGGPDPNFVDGNFYEVKFNSPQGVTFMDSDNILVADTENHAIRKIILNEKKVITLAGTGKQGTDKIGGNIGTKQEISSPWDLVVFKTRDMDMSFHMDEKNIPEKSIILIAMAGTHQIWGYFVEDIIWWKFKKFDKCTCVSLMGNGLEENRNNSYAHNAAFAQPSGLAMANDLLFIADSESSSIRKASMLDGKVMPVVGGDRNPLNLFAYGDIDGKQFSAKLQHPLGLAYNSLTKKIFVADTYNHKIKCIDIDNNSIETCLIKDENQCNFQFNEPGGLCFDTGGEYMLVADTNNHNIQLIHMESMKTKRLNLDFSKIVNKTVEFPSFMLKKALPLKTCEQIKMNFDISLKNGLNYTENAPQSWKITLPNSKYSASTMAGKINNGKWTVSILCNANESENSSNDIFLNCLLSLCNNNACIKKNFTIVFYPSDTTPFKNVHSENITLHITESNVTMG